MIKTKYVEVKEERRGEGKKKKSKKENTHSHTNTHIHRDTDTHKNLPGCRVLYPRWVMKKIKIKIKIGSEIFTGLSST